MQGFTFQRLGGLRNTWITDLLSEILSSFIVALLAYASGFQSLVTNGQASTPSGRALACGCGVMLGIFASFNSTGGSANPNVSIMLCLTGRLQWKKLPVYILGEIVGAFLAAAVTYAVYNDMLTSYDGGVRSIYGDTASAQLFTSLPNVSIITKATGFFDVVVGTSLLTGSIAAITDPLNANTDPGVIPIANVFMIFGILMAFGVNTGAAINFAIDFSGRLFASIVYGSGVFSYWNYWFWVPLLGGVTGAILGPFVYQLLVGNHLHVSAKQQRKSPQRTTERHRFKEIRSKVTVSNSLLSSDG